MIFLGIDGGGSKTAFLLEDDAGRQLARFETGPANWISAGAETASESIQAGISQLPSMPDIVCGGFAGAGRPEGITFYRSCLQSLLPRSHIIVETDAFISYVGAIGVKPGVLLIAGTGSIAIAREEDGTMLRVGGWGPVFGDEGGGYWIGREAVRTALRAHDTQAFPEFTRSIADALNLGSIIDVVGAWTAGNLNTRSIAALATLLFAQYPAEPSGQILRDAAACLRLLTENAIHRAALPRDCIKSAAGSVASQPAIQELVGLNFSQPAQTPERGAILWARARINPS